MATTVNITTAWTQINNLVTDNSGFLVTGGSSVEIITKNTIPSNDDKGAIILRNQFCNIYSSVNTYVRSTSTSKILIDISFLNFKLREFVIVESGGIKYSLNLDTKKLIVTLNTGSINVTPDLVSIMNYIPTILAPYGFQLFSFGIRSNIISVRAISSGLYYTCFLAIDTASGTFRLIDLNTRATLGAGDCQMLTGDLVLELLLT